MNNPSRMTPEEMLTAVESCNALAWKLAYDFRRQNPSIQPGELHAVAVAAFKHAALLFDKTRGCKFITPACQYARFALINYCRRESARGMHVPESHEPYFAPPMRRTLASWQHPAVHDERDEFGEDFWQAVLRDLCEGDRAAVLAVYRDDMSYSEAAVRLGVTKQRVQQKLKRAMAKLRARADLRQLAGDVA